MDTKINIELNSDEIYLILECLSLRRITIDDYLEEEFDKEEIERYIKKQTSAKNLQTRITKLIDKEIETKFFKEK